MKDFYVTIDVVQVGNSKLVVFYDKEYDGLWRDFASDDEIKNYIRNDIDIAFKRAVKKEGNMYFLNVASVENFGFIPEKDFLISMKELITDLMQIYQPLIERFKNDKIRWK